MTPAPGEFPKRCACCGAVLSAADWSGLRFVGVQADEVETLELRDCACGSTLAIAVLSILDDEGCP